MISKSIFELIIVNGILYSNSVAWTHSNVITLYTSGPEAYAHMCSRQLSFLAPQCVQFSASVETSEHYRSLHHGKLQATMERLLETEKEVMRITYVTNLSESWQN